eukprot:6186731-Pleurochrysis_carterae.AAC.1
MHVIQAWPVKSYQQWHGYFARMIARHFIGAYEISEAIRYAQTLVESPAFKELITKHMGDDKFFEYATRIRFNYLEVLNFLYNIDADQLFKFIDTSSKAQSAALSHNRKLRHDPWVYILDLQDGFDPHAYKQRSFLAS